MRLHKGPQCGAIITTSQGRWRFLCLGFHTVSASTITINITTTTTSVNTSMRVSGSARNRIATFTTQHGIHDHDSSSRRSRASNDHISE